MVVANYNGSYYSAGCTLLTLNFMLIRTDCKICHLVIFVSESNVKESRASLPSARMRSEGCGSRSVCLSVSLSVYDYSRTTVYGAACDTNSFSGTWARKIKWCTGYLGGTRSHSEGCVSTPACYLLL